MKLQQTFHKGKMNLDADERFIEKGEYRQALNFKVQNSESATQGAGVKPLGTRRLTNTDYGTNPVSIGVTSDTYLDKIYYAIVTDEGHSFVMEYDVVTETSTFLLADTRTENILNFSADHRVQMDVLVNTDNDETFLFFTDNHNAPRLINTERAKTYTENGFVEEDISVIKAPPLSPPSINLFDTNSNENNLEERFLIFAYRFKYLDNQYSALSPFSPVAFRPETFAYDYSTSTNTSMINAFNGVDITFETGSERVTDVEILFKESQSQDVYLIETLNKIDRGYMDNSSYTFRFTNNKAYRKLAERHFFRLYDNVPLKAYAQAIVNNRIVYGYYTENFDLIDVNGEAVIPAYELSANTTSVTTPVLSLKSNRDYEVGIRYIDDFNRGTTVMTSDLNTIFFPNSNAVTRNRIDVEINSKAPSFATKYRMYIKQRRPNYDNLSLNLFYQDGIYVWLKLEGNDVDKINEGDIITVKADSQGLLDEAVKVKVLEIKTQPRNFIDVNETTNTLQLAGTYFRIKSSAFRISEADFTNHKFTGYDSSANKHDNPIRGSQVDFIEEAHHYGSGLNDCTSGGTYSGSDDVRYRIEIDAEGTPDTFRWSKDNGATFEASGVAITGGAQTLDNGVEVTFGATTGHTLNDYWMVSAKDANTNGLGGGENSKAYALYQSVEDEVIEAGAQITFIYDEYNEATEYVEKVFVSSQQYANIEEWYYGDNIELGIPPSRIWFRRGTIGSEKDANYVTLNTADEMVMIIKSRGTQNNDFDSRVKVQSKIEIFQSSQSLLFETETEEEIDVFYEVGDVYDIDTATGYHYGSNGALQSLNSPALVTMDVGNCFTWGNGYESIKIRDGFTENRYNFDTKPLDIIPDYKKNVRIASLSYSQKLEQTTGFNGLNEFNLAEINYLDMDDRYGTIQKLYPRDTNLMVFQENKTHQILVDKDILFDADGNENVRQSTNFLNTIRSYSYEGGISLDPYSFAVEGNNIWHTDTFRGNVMRLGADGYTKISNYGARAYFRSLLNTSKKSLKLGAYDPYNDQFVLHVADPPPEPAPEVTCNHRFIKYDMTQPFSYNFKLNNFGGNVRLAFTTDSDITLSVIFDSVDYGGAYTAGGHVIDFARTTLAEDIVAVTVTPTSGNATYTITNTCPVGFNTSVSQYVLADGADIGTTMEHYYTINGKSVKLGLNYDTFNSVGLERFDEMSDVESKPTVPTNGDIIRMYVKRDGVTTNGTFETNFGNGLSYLVSQTVYGKFDFGTVYSLTTKPTIISSGVGTEDEEHYIEFTFNKNNDDDRLYLMWDYRDTNLNAIDDNVSVLKGEATVLNVLENDAVSGTYIIDSVTNGTNGTVTINPDGRSVTYTHDDSATSSDTFTYTVINEMFPTFPTASDTATVNVTISTLTELRDDTGGSANLIQFGLSDTSMNTLNSACNNLTTTVTRYHNGVNVLPALGDTVYLDVDANEALDGEYQWFATSNNTVLLINNDGVVDGIGDCTSEEINFE